jgi:hypothetical protein
VISVVVEIGPCEIGAKVRERRLITSSESSPELLALPQETEWAEFKHNNLDPQLIGEYLSAISNSAALESQPFGWIVWALKMDHNVIGTSFKPRQQKGQGNEDLNSWLNKLLATLYQLPHL